MQLVLTSVKYLFLSSVFGPLNKKINLTLRGEDEQETSDNNIPLRGEPTKNATLYTIREY